MAGIRTPDQRLRVFVSSTMKELAGERAAVQDSIRRLRLTPVLFELGERLFTDAWQAGQALTRDEAAAYAATA